MKASAIQLFNSFTIFLILSTGCVRKNYCEAEIIRPIRGIRVPLITQRASSIHLFLFLLICQLPLLTMSQQQPYPAAVINTLNQTKTNRAELEKLLNHFNQPADSLKRKAAIFLVANMDIHHSESYYWADSLGRKVFFDETNYIDFATSLQAFDSIKKTVNKIHPVAYTYKDIDTLKADFLIDNINKAFEWWNQPFANKLSFADFCEYLLPYRISVEPVQDWRKIYAEKFKPIIQKRTQIDSALRYLKKDIGYWFTCTYNLEKRADPIPRLGALQLLIRKKGPCEDIADLTVFTLRSQGIPASIDYVPAWATSSGNHTLNVALTSSGNPIHYDILAFDTVKDFIREPAKVIRSLYSRQTNTLPYFESINNIPSGFMRLTNYKDVTKEYWQTRDVHCKINKMPSMPKIAYAAVINYSKWEVAWWGFVKNDSVIFKDMCQGAVFLPMYYINGKLKAAGYPIASGYNGTKVLQPDTTNTISITIKEQENYLRYRSGKKYKFYYWNSSWKLIGEKTAIESTKEMVFHKVPKDALYMLIPEYTKRKERPFSFNEKGEREWW